jgi:hypothetical protein
MGQLHLYGATPPLWNNPTFMEQPHLYGTTPPGSYLLCYMKKIVSTHQFFQARKLLFRNSLAVLGFKFASFFFAVVVVALGEGIIVVMGEIARAETHD